MAGGSFYPNESISNYFRASYSTDGAMAAIDEYLATLEQVEGLPIEFSRRLWNMTVDTLTVYEGKGLVFRWKNGTTSEWSMG